MSIITRTYTFTDGTTAYGSQVESEVSNITTTLNNLDAATQAWTNVKGATINATTVIQAASGTFTGALAMGTNKITGLSNGTASSDAAAFGQIPTLTSWAAYTPTVTGCGTVTSLSFFWKQISDTVFVKGVFTTGTCSAAAVSLTLPNSNIINSSHAAQNFLMGTSERILTAASATHGAAQILNVFYDGSNTNLVFLTAANGTNTFTKTVGSTVFANGDTCTVFFDFPI